jgi:hypothetical protein
MEAVLRVDPDLGNIYVPDIFKKLISLPNMPVKRMANMGEYAIWTVVQKRFNEEKHMWETLWASITHNERVDMGASIQVSADFGTVGTTPNGKFNVVAVASATLAGKAKADLSLASTSANATTNEFTTIGLSRATGTVQNYVAPSTLGGVYSVDVYKSFTLSGGGTAYGAGLFDSTTVSGSHLYAEDNFGSTAVLISGDTLNVTATVSN